MEHVRDYSAALEAYSRALKLPQDSEEVWYYLNNNSGYCLIQLGRHQEAEKYCRSAIQIEPRRHNAHKNLALSLQHQCRYVQAARSFIRATKLCPNDGRALEHLKDLIGAHPEIAEDIPELMELFECNGMGQGTEGEFRLQ